MQDKLVPLLWIIEKSFVTNNITFTLKLIIII
jgi:hypothetical protein